MFGTYCGEWCYGVNLLRGLSTPFQTAPSRPLVVDSNFDVSSGGGTGSYTIGSQTANATGEDGGVCVARDGNAEGMQVPLTVV